MTTEPSEFNSDVWSATVKMLATAAVGTAVFMTALITAINLTPPVTAAGLMATTVQ